MDITKKVALLRFHHHGNLLNVNNVLNQLGLRSDEKAEEIATKHVMIMVNDCLPRLGYEVKIH